jgi:hypothetical protein
MWSFAICIPHNLLLGWLNVTEMGRTCSTREDDGRFSILVGGAGGRRPLGRPRHTGGNVIEMDLVKCGMNVCTGFNWLRMGSKSCDSSIDVATGLRAGRSGFDFRLGLGIFLFATVTRPTLRPSQSPVRWVAGAVSPGVKRPGLEADHSPPSSAEAKNAWSYTSTPPLSSRHGAYLSTGILPLPYLIKIA